MTVTNNWHLTDRIVYYKRQDEECIRRRERQRERKGEGDEEEKATLQSAVTLMTPFITMCRLTSWQRHAAPDGGEGHSITPTLDSSFVEGQQEGSCGWGRRGRDRSCIGAQLDWHCTGSALQGCTLSLCCDSRWSKLWPDLARSKTSVYHSALFGRNLTPTLVQLLNNTHREISANMLHSEFKVKAG